MVYLHRYICIWFLFCFVLLFNLSSSNQFFRNLKKKNLMTGYVYRLWLKCLKIHTTKIEESACACVCLTMRSVVLRCMGLKLGMGVGNEPTRLKSVFSKQSHQRSNVILRSSSFGNALWPSNLVGRTLDPSVMHLLESKIMKVSAGVNQGSNCSGMPYAN